MFKGPSGHTEQLSFYRKMAELQEKLKRRYALLFEGLFRCKIKFNNKLNIRVTCIMSLLCCVFSIITFARFLTVYLYIHK